MLRYTGMGAGAAWVLASCGLGGTEGGGNEKQAADFWAGQEIAGELNFANWPYYIDKDRVNGEIVRPTLVDFTKEFGIEVNYKEVINENEQFFGRIQPSLAAGEDTGFDLMVLTNGPTLDKLIRLNYLVELDQSKLSNFHENAAAAYLDRSYDPGNRFTVPWQSGITGIGYNPKLTGREITSFEDLFDPAFEGKVGMMGDTLDMPNLALLGTGVIPEESTPEDWRRAADELIKQRDSGVVRQFYIQNYIKALTAGDTWLSMAWSGDIFQQNNSGFPDLEFVVPKEGGLLWTDNMCIPAKAAHPLDAITMMDFVYRPEIAAQMADWIQFITPVPAAEDIIRDDLKDPTVADSPLVFPTEEMYSKVYPYRTLTQEEEEEWNSIFQPVFQG